MWQIQTNRSISESIRLSWKQQRRTRFIPLVHIKRSFKGQASRHAHQALTHSRNSYSRIFLYHYSISNFCHHIAGIRYLDLNNHHFNSLFIFSNQLAFDFFCIVFILPVSILFLLSKDKRHK